jgi:prepilin-type N-terminal cleavage/methylation domain-containing protein
MGLSGLTKKVIFSRGDHGGYTLVELLVALAIGSLVVVAASQILQQVLFLVPKAEASMLAMRQVQFAGHWIDSDARMAQVIRPTPMTTPINLSATSLVFSSINWKSDNTTVTYSVDSNHQLNRAVKVNSGTVTTLQVADSIDSLTAQYAQPAGKDRKVLTITIIAKVWNVSENRTYQTSPRSY